MLGLLRGLSTTVVAPQRQGFSIVEFQILLSGLLQTPQASVSCKKKLSVFVNVQISEIINMEKSRDSENVRVSDFFSQSSVNSSI